MPQIGEVRRVRDIGGYKGNYPNRYIWHACMDCGKKRWVQLKPKFNIPVSIRCHSCAVKLNPPPIGAKSHKWKGGRIINGQGYVEVWISPDDFFYPMIKKSGYVLEHRLVVAKALGRNLHRWEIVHHKGVKYQKGSIEDKQDNRYPENLQLVTDDRHKQISILEGRITYLEKRVTLLEAENSLLRATDSKYIF